MAEQGVPGAPAHDYTMQLYPVNEPKKAAPGEHDMPITFDHVVERIGSERAKEVRRITLAILKRTREICEPRGIIVADTKVELGINMLGKPTLGDEVLTPDSSRFWPKDLWVPGKMITGQQWQ